MPSNNRVATPSGPEQDSRPTGQPVPAGEGFRPAGDDDPLAITEIELEEVSLDGICGVY